MDKLDFDKKIERVEEFTAVYPSYYAVLSAEVRYAKISIEARFLYGEITALVNTNGRLVADIRYFAHLYEVTPRKIVSWLKELKGQNLISSKIFISGELAISI